MNLKEKKLLTVLGVILFGFIAPFIILTIADPKTGNPIGYIGLIMIGIPVSLNVFLSDIDWGTEFLRISIMILVQFLIYLLLGFLVCKALYPSKTSKATEPDEKSDEKDEQA